MDFIRHVFKYFRSRSRSRERSPKTVSPQTVIQSVPITGPLVPIWAASGELLGYQAAANPSLPVPKANQPCPPNPQPSGLELSSQRPPLNIRNSHENQPSIIPPDRSPTAEEFPINLKTRPRPTNWDGWPNNDWTHHFSWEEYVITGGLQSQWSHKMGTSNKGYRNASTPQRGRRSKRQCRGVFECSNESCSNLVRPHVDKKSIEVQMAKLACDLCYQPLVYIQCQAYESLTRYQDGCIYKHVGTHNHQRPPIKSALPWEEDRFEELILAYPEATPAQLRVGVSTPLGRTLPVSDISDAYLNSDRVAIRRKIALRQWKQPSGGDDFLQQLQAFDSKHPDFILHNSFTSLPKTVIVLQTPWMRAQSVHDSDLDGPINGIVTDGAHGFWKSRTAVLQVSSVYLISLDRWIPVIISYMDGHSAQEFKVHFLSLFRGIADIVESRGGNDLDRHLATVMDFSQAQREGFILAYIELYSTQTGDKRDEFELREAAESLLKGCAEHFRQAVSRVGKSHAVVDALKEDDFIARAIHLSRVSSYEDYEEIARGLINEFPRATQFFAWWLRPSRASMIMKSQRVMEEELWYSIPDTTNAQEAAHWATYCAAGTNHTLLSGLEALHAFVASFEREDMGAKRGQKNHYGYDRREKRMAREHGRTHPNRDPSSNRGKRYVNDGRAPDTTAKLAGKKTLEKQRKEATVTLNDTFGSIYFSWKANSCWLDVSLVLLNNALSRRWEEFEGVCAPVLGKGALGVVVGALQRIQSIKSNPVQDSDFGRDLDVQRDLIRDALFEETIILDNFSPDMVFVWLSSLIRRSQTIHRFDGEGQFIPYFLPLYCEIHQCTGCERTGGPHMELSHYLKGLFSTQLGRADHETYDGRLAHWFKSFLAPEATTGLRCWRLSDKVGLLCSGRRTDYRRYILSLPVILVLEFVQEDLPQALEWYIPPTLQTSYSTLTRGCGLEYELVGLSIVSHNPAGNHFTARYYNAGEKSVYVYDDMANRGRAQRMRDGVLSRHVAGFPLKLPSKQAVHHAVYHLKGGLVAQEAFYKARLAELYKDMNITADSQRPCNASSLGYSGKLSLLPSQRRIWIKSGKNRNLYDEYVDPLFAGWPVEERAITPLTPESEEPINISEEQPQAVNIADLYNRVQTPYSDEDLPSLNTFLRPSSPRPFPRLTPSANSMSPRARVDTPSASSMSPRARVDTPSASSMSPRARVDTPSASSMSPRARVDTPSASSMSPRARVDTPSASSMSPRTRVLTLELDDFSDSSMTTLQSNSERKPFTPSLNCRCGVVGNPKEIYAISPREGDLLQCSGCKRLSHLACEPYGRFASAKWKCWPCSMLEPPITPKKEVTDRWMLSNVWLVNRKLSERLRPGVGALCRLGDFYYPVRLLKYDAGTQQWAVQWWRGCRFFPGGPSRLPDDITSEPQSSIADAHWGEPMARRDIRLGVWTLASTIEEDTLDYLSEVNYMAYTTEIHEVLNPHLSTLHLLVNPPASMEDSTIPILNRTRGIKVNSFENGVKDAPRGAIPLRVLAGITNWLYIYLGLEASLQSRWQTGPAMCHACTLWIANRLQTANWEKVDELSWIEEAWRIQTNTGRANSLDINKDCISKLERLMFEFSKNAGKAGDFLWGLNSGDHQEGWNPYVFLPEQWNFKDHEVDQLHHTIGWNYIKVPPPPNTSITTSAHVTMMNDTESSTGEGNEVQVGHKRPRSPEPADPVESAVRGRTRGRGRGRGHPKRARGRGGRGGRGSGKNRAKKADERVGL